MFAKLLEHLAVIHSISAPVTQLRQIWAVGGQLSALYPILVNVD